MGPLGNLSPVGKLVFFLMLVMAGFFLFMVLGLILAWPLFRINLLTNISLMNDVTNPAITGLLKFFQLMQSLGLFFVPPLLAGYFFMKNPLKYLRLDEFSSGSYYLSAFLVLLVSAPFLGWTVALNESMTLPSFLNGIEQWMRASEDQAAMLTDVFLNAPSFLTFLFNIFLIALLPAVGEELLFRGVLQKIFGQWFRNIHIAIFFTAFIFAAIHMQFYGFLPRMLLGLLLGYLFYWSGSLWVPIFAHFLNNGTAVVASYLSQKGVITGDYENFGTSGSSMVIIISAILSAIILYKIYLRSLREKNQIS